MFLTLGGGERSPAGPVWTKRGELRLARFAPSQPRLQRSGLRPGDISHPRRHTALLRVANYLSQIFVVKWRTCDFVQEITNISFVTYLELT